MLRCPRQPGSCCWSQSCTLHREKYHVSICCYEFSDSCFLSVAQIPTRASVSGYLGASEGQEDELGKALTGASVVVIPAGVPRKPGMTRDDLFNVSWRIYFKELFKGILSGLFCWSAILLNTLKYSHCSLDQCRYCKNSHRGVCWVLPWCDDCHH